MRSSITIMGDSDASRMLSSSCRTVSGSPVPSEFSWSISTCAPPRPAGRSVPAQLLLYLGRDTPRKCRQQALTAARGPPRRLLRPPALKLRTPGGDLA